MEIAELGVNNLFHKTMPQSWRALTERLKAGSMGGARLLPSEVLDVMQESIMYDAWLVITARDIANGVLTEFSWD